MWKYEKKLQYPVNIKNTNPKYAQITKLIAYAFWYRGQDANHILLKEKYSQKEGDGLHGKLCLTVLGAENRR